ncbi:sulfotransferase family protein [Crateriforma conspicua]|uniref:Sulfotransferase domain protein n=1 Tax=Crateriforma conspicua TaxID=2527996 RepID=A0A5C5XYP5_9PLAN|nr:sulfotransferase [Crateriforma conspicua]QDV63123.1 Sulfotransferase domain protein [Crateriforma conspicua]TWT68110.1 Sulfotransferase domain protein [Crateriforma conspicua]
MDTAKPNFFIVGAPKSGTSALAFYLSEHPQVFFSRPKELFYWSEDHQYARERHGVYTLESYLRFFEDSDPALHKAIGEGSVNYLQSHNAIENILAFNPDAKFIAMLRDPVDVAYGMHGELVRHYFEDELDFEKAWGLQSDRASGIRIPDKCVMRHQLQYQDVATFSPQIERLHTLVPESQRLLLFFDDLKKDTGAVYQQTLEFLGLTDDGRSEFPRVNPARTYRSHAIGRLYQTPPKWLEPAMKRVRHWYASLPGNKKDMLAGMMAKKEARAPLREEFATHLRDIFRTDVEKLEVMLSRDLAHWK